MGNILYAVIASYDAPNRTEPLYQYDYGQKMVLSGIDLPDSYTVHYSRTYHGVAKQAVGGADGVDILDEYLQTPGDLHAWVYVHTGEDDGETEAHIIIPVIARAKATDEAPTPAQQGVIDQLMAQLEAAAEKAEDASTHGPTIVDGTWRLWDAATEAYTDTGIPSSGVEIVRLI